MPLHDNPFIALSYIGGPALLTNCSALLLLSTSNRLARAVDRSRYLVAELVAPDAVGTDHMQRELEVGQRRVVIAGQAMTTDQPDTFESHDMMNLVGYRMSEAAAQQVYTQAGVGPQDLDVVELHDCFAQNELITYEALGLCGEGEAPRLIDNNDTTYGGRWVVNPSGGLISKGHPLGATGLAQCSELTWQLRGTADKRQVDGVNAALQHNIGLGGAAVVTAYQRAER